MVRAYPRPAHEGRMWSWTAPGVVCRRLGATAAILALSAVSLGLVGTPSADASCAGPQLALEQDGLNVPLRRAGEGDAEKIV